MKIAHELKFLANSTFKKIFGYIFVSEKTIETLKSNLIHTLSTLQETQSALQETQSALQETQSALQETQSALQETQSTLQETQSALQETEFDLLYASNRSELLRLICLEKVQENFILFCAQNLISSNSQLLQDLIASFLQQAPGFFCEIGAADGKKLSNTFFLEKEKGWKGIISEPAQIFREELVDNRDCQISFKCVFNHSDVMLAFNETLDPLLSTIESFSENDRHSSSREGGNIYEVETITLNDLLEEFFAPNYIDYLSVDTEGSEYEILKNFDFEKYTFGFISVEHNYSETRRDLNQLLTSNGYTRIMTNVSMWDDYYISNSLVSRILLP